MRFRNWMAISLAAGVMANCSSPAAGGGGGGGADAGGGGMDVVSTSDGGMMKGGDGGGGGTDARVDTGTATDRPPPRDTGPVITNPCAADAQVDLTSMMPNSMGVVVYQGNNNRAPEEGGLTPPMGCIAGMGAFLGHQVAHRYRMRSNAVLEISTANENTPETFDTAVMIASACSMSATSLACNDDISQGVLQSRARTSAPIAMGTEVIIVVGSYNPAFNGSDVQGDYELQIREVAATPIGMPCTPASVCVEGAACIANPGSTTMGTCIADGARTGRCRLPAMGDAGAVATCDMGLICSVATPTTTSRGQCLQEVMVGAECQMPGTRCSMGSTCQAAPTSMSADRRLCIADGAQGGNCRMADPRCDGMLQCSSSNACRAAAMAGGECDLTGRRDFCPSGSSCVANAMLTGGVCAAIGTAAGAPCRDVDAGARCDMGLTCSTMTGAGVCRREVPAGMTCDLRYNTTACAGDAVCTAGMTAGQGTCTAPVAEMEPNNMPAMGNGPVTMSTNFRAALAEGETDCFRVTVPMGASIRAETTDANGTCNLGMGADTIVTLYNPMNAEIATNDDGGVGLCSLIDPAAVAAARNLTAGTYAVCVTGYMGSAAIANYFLRVTITPGM